MDVSNRILEILEKSGLTPSEFADKIEVQRSAISHITSGRNKPSLEFLIKIKNAFPEIDTDWLIFGIKKEEVSENISEQDENIALSTSSYPTLFDFAEPEDLNEKEDVDDQKNVKTENSNSKKIKKIVFFYEDGTFDDFSQNQN